MRRTSVENELASQGLPMVSRVVGIPGADELWSQMDFAASTVRNELTAP